MVSRRFRHGSVVEFALLVPLIALLLLAFFDLTLAVLRQLRLERLGAEVVRQLGLSRAPDVVSLQALAEERTRRIDPTMTALVTLHAVPSKKVGSPRENGPVEVIDLVLTQPLPHARFLWPDSLLLKAQTREVRLR